MEEQERLKIRCEYHVVYLEGEGFIYRNHDSNEMWTFNDPSQVPEEGHIMFNTSYDKLARQIKMAVKHGSINGKYADITTWCDRGLKIVCVTGFLYHHPEMGEWRPDTGDLA